jgi:hypothetical protein
MAFRMGLSFDTDGLGWIPQGLQNKVLVWRNAQGDGIGLYQFDLIPDLPAPLEDLQTLRARFSDGNSGRILLDVVELDGLQAMKSIVKVRQNPTGMTYVGSYIVPRQEFSYVLKIQCREEGTTGIREAIVFERMFASGQVNIQPDKSVGGWVRNPEKVVAETWMSLNAAEDTRFDIEFPEHPLSRLRQYMQHLEPSIRIADFVKQAPQFTGSQTKTKKPWWQLFRRQ